MPLPAGGVQLLTLYPRRASVMTKSKTKKENLFKVLFLGDNNIGKTAFIRRYVDATFTRTWATIGVSFDIKVLKWSDSETVRLQLWDTAGHERFTELMRAYYRLASACVVMFDVTNRQSFLRSKWLKNDLDSKVTLPDGSAVPCILLANKCDLSPWEVTKDEIDEFSKENRFIGWTETSVKENTNINESMRLLVAKMLGAGEELTALSGAGDYINLTDVPKPNQQCY